MCKGFLVSIEAYFHLTNKGSFLYWLSQSSRSHLSIRASLIFVVDLGVWSNGRVALWSARFGVCFYEQEVGTPIVWEKKTFVVHKA